MSALRVLVDAHMIGHRQTGNETYVRELLVELGRRPDVSVAAAVETGTPIPDEIRATDVECLRLASGGNASRLLWGLAALSRRFGADVVHGTYVSAWRCGCPTVVTVHDVSFRRFPGLFSPRDRLLFATLVPASLRRAAAVITDSQHARAEIGTFFPALRTPVTAIPLGVGPEFHPVTDPGVIEDVRRRHDVDAPFLLAVGNLQPRKNLANLVRAFARLRRRFPTLTLLVVGQAQWRASSLFALACDLGLDTAVRFTGYVPRADLAALYSAARVFVYPSTYEGFGLPVLEAMACATPVVAVHTSSIPEVSGDAARLAPAATADALHDSLVEVLGDDHLRQTLVERGLQRAARFSWAETARRTSQVYQAACPARSGRSPA